MATTGRCVVPLLSLPVSPMRLSLTVSWSHSEATHGTTAVVFTPATSLYRGLEVKGPLLTLYSQLPLHLHSLSFLKVPPQKKPFTLDLNSGFLPYWSEQSKIDCFLNGSKLWDFLSRSEIHVLSVKAKNLSKNC
jgi:hypothetical protein